MKNLKKFNEFYNIDESVQAMPVDTNSLTTKITEMSLALEEGKEVRPLGVINTTPSFVNSIIVGTGMGDVILIDGLNIEAQDIEEGEFLPVDNGPRDRGGFVIINNMDKMPTRSISLLLPELKTLPSRWGVIGLFSNDAPDIWADKFDIVSLK